MFRLAVELFACRPQDCLFVGDHPKWDMVGARRAGMFPVLMDRGGSYIREGYEYWIDSLWGLDAILRQWEVTYSSQHRGSRLV
jgi:FMN phosphatase YigB (HAD superfamily)